MKLYVLAILVIFRKVILIIYPPPFSSPYDEILINSHTTFFPLELSLRLLLLGIKLPLLSRGQFDSVYTSFESMHAQVILLQ